MALITGGSSGGGGGGIGSPSLVYRYTVAGVDKASIDTGVDTPDAGFNVWTNGDLLEIWMYLRTDEVAGLSGVAATVNNSSSAIYDRQSLAGTNATASASNGSSGTSWSLACAGANMTSGTYSALELVIPNFTGTVGSKTAAGRLADVDNSGATNAFDILYALGWRSTAAIVRFAITPSTGGAKFKVGSQLLIYKRLAS